MRASAEKLEHLLELGGIKKDIILLVISGIAVICSLFQFQPLPFDMAWFAIVLCGMPIIWRQSSDWSRHLTLRRMYWYRWP